MTPAYCSTQTTCRNASVRLRNLKHSEANDRRSPNVQVTVTLTDIFKNPETPFAIIGTDSVLKGQGAPIGWNPYVVSPRFVVNRVEDDQSLGRKEDRHGALQFWSKT